MSEEKTNNSNRSIDNALKFIRKICCISLVLFIACNDSSDAVSSNQFAKHIRTTEALSPEDERLAFKVPDGFKVELFASEPDIGKPLNMAFDDRGRMWLTQSFEYPFPDTTGAGKDRISILEDSDGDGRADQITTFTDSLNIPIGLVTVPGGVIAYSIPNIYHLIDHNGDDRVDERKVILGEFEYDDTHGMINNLIRSWDGWIHAGHGFANTSKVSGSDGDSIEMFSGNTFRFKPDGSRVEFTTTGRVNPFGFAYDEFGYTYSVDCHTSPIYQLVRGADYPHFGKQPTGIGFGPALMTHNYGSTALAGLEYYLGSDFPQDYQESFFLGDVVKCRVYRATMEWQGTTPVIVWQDDFLISKDPWFRPVDVKMGPDGALYVADFYNSIIGHYEVPLNHPARDRQRGRIWRISYEGKDVSQGSRSINQASLDDLVDLLAHDNLPYRMSVADQIVDRFGSEAVPFIKSALQEEDPKKEIQCLWILYRLNRLEDDELIKALNHEDAAVRVHALRISFEIGELDNLLLEKALDLMDDASPHVQRQSIMVLSQNPRKSHVQGLLDKISSLKDSEDSHFYYSVRQSLRDHLRNGEILDWVLQQDWTDKEVVTIAELMLGVDKKEASQYLAENLQSLRDHKDLLSFVGHSVKWANSQNLPGVVMSIRNLSEGTNQEQYPLFKSVLTGLVQGGHDQASYLGSWFEVLVEEVLRKDLDSHNDWTVDPVIRQRFVENSWNLVDGLGESDQSGVWLVSESINDPQNRVSSIVSPPFVVEDDLEIFVASGSDQGSQQVVVENFHKVEILNSADYSLIQTFDITNNAAPFRLDIDPELMNKEILVRITDLSPDRGSWIAVRGTGSNWPSLPRMSPSTASSRQILIIDALNDFDIQASENELIELFHNRAFDLFTRLAAGNALIERNPERNDLRILDILNDQREADLFKVRLSVLIAERNVDGLWSLLLNGFESLSYAAQKNVIMLRLLQENGASDVISGANSDRIPKRLLVDGQIKLRMEEVMSRDELSQVGEMTRDIPTGVASLQSVIDERLRQYRDAEASLSQGQVAYEQYCSVCHQMDGRGGDIGPQLDAIGHWGARALTEKIIDPNRNISKAFVNYRISLKDGATRIGLFRREDGATEIFADALGEEFALLKTDIEEKEVSPNTLMPDHFRHTIPEASYYDLLHFLLNEK